MNRKEVFGLFSFNNVLMVYDFMKKPLSKQRSIIVSDKLFNRVVAILDQARNNVVRAVNTNMVVAYWLIGREIVLEVQEGKKRAEYGEQVLSDLSSRLEKRYGDGFSATNLRYFRTFFKVYADRLQIQHPTGAKSSTAKIQHPLGAKLGQKELVCPSGEKKIDGFSPRLSWSHYRALMRVKDEEARLFYEQEAEECGWSKEQLERQIHTFYYQRIIANKGKKRLVVPKRERLAGDFVSADTILKSPLVLEFLGLPDSPVLHEDQLEQAIIDNLQSFLLELGKGFSFVARQKHIRFDDEDYYVDLVCYNYFLKCFLLIDLKMGKLTHRDVGQMDGYVRLYEDQYKILGDNPTIGLILCSSKSEAVAKYSVLAEHRQVFAAKYLECLPSEEDLRIEIQNERRLIEGRKV
jgi:predicted nuclease of restriction endonuclease-like (RecB) superfamily